MFAAGNPCTAADRDASRNPSNGNNACDDNWTMFVLPFALHVVVFAILCPMMVCARFRVTTRSLTFFQESELFLVCVMLDPRRALRTPAVLWSRWLFLWMCVTLVAWIAHRRDRHALLLTLESCERHAMGAAALLIGGRLVQAAHVCALHVQPRARAAKRHLHASARMRGRTGRRMLCPCMLRSSVRANSIWSRGAGTTTASRIRRSAGRSRSDGVTTANLDAAATAVAAPAVAAPAATDLARAAGLFCWTASWIAPACRWVCLLSGRIISSYTTHQQP